MQTLIIQKLWLRLVAILGYRRIKFPVVTTFAGRLIAGAFLAALLPISLAFSFSSSNQNGRIVSCFIQHHHHAHPYRPACNTGSSNSHHGRRLPLQETWRNIKLEKRQLLSSQSTLSLRFNDDLDEVDIITSSSSSSSSSSRTTRNQNNNNEDDVDPTWKERSKRWILLVDDEVDICKSVGNYLFEQGYQVTTCTNAPTALEIIQHGGGRGGNAKQRPRCRPVLPHSNYDDFLKNEVMEQEQQSSDSDQIVVQQRFRPDVIVSDVRMPEMDGIELLNALRSDDNLVDIPVVLLTAKSQTQDRIAGYNAGADAYIPKPFDPEELVTIVDSVVARHEQASADLILTSNKASADVSIEDLQKDLAEIKYLLLKKGGGGIDVGGFVQATNVFLAPDEQEILELLCQGLMNKEIAAKMYLSTRRVQQLLTDMFRKANVKNRTELVRWAINTGNVQI